MKKLIKASKSILGIFTLTCVSWGSPAQKIIAANSSLEADTIAIVEISKNEPAQKLKQFFPEILSNAKYLGISKTKNAFYQISSFETISGDFIYPTYVRSNALKRYSIENMSLSKLVSKENILYEEVKKLPAGALIDQSGNFNLKDDSNLFLEFGVSKKENKLRIYASTFNGDQDLEIDPEFVLPGVEKPELKQLYKSLINLKAENSDVLALIDKLNMNESVKLDSYQSFRESLHFNITNSYHLSDFDELGWYGNYGTIIETILTMANTQTIQTQSSGAKSKSQETTKEQVLKRFSNMLQYMGDEADANELPVSLLLKQGIIDKVSVTYSINSNGKHLNVLSIDNFGLIMSAENRNNLPGFDIPLIYVDFKALHALFEKGSEERNFLEDMTNGSLDMLINSSYIDF